MGDIGVQKHPAQGSSKIALYGSARSKCHCFSLASKASVGCVLHRAMCTGEMAWLALFENVSVQANSPPEQVVSVRSFFQEKRANVESLVGDIGVQRHQP